jgi:hypothetical protein
MPAGRTVAPEGIYPCPGPQDKSPDAAPTRELQTIGSTILNDKYQYETASGKPYRFKSHQELLAYRMGLLRQVNVNTGNYPNAAPQSTLTNEQMCK